MIKDRKYIKPPLGILPKVLFDEFLSNDIQSNGGMSLQKVTEDRLSNLKGAISRYLESNEEIDIEWIIEYNQKLKDLGLIRPKFIFKK